MLQSNVLAGGAARTDGALRWSLAIAALGALAYAVLAMVVAPLAAREPFGVDIYDYYYLAILDGRLDVPARILRYEGHYAPDGTGYLYHGLAPLLTRFLAGWALPLPQISMAYLSIWIWTVAGTACYHAALIRLAGDAWPDRGRWRTAWAAALAAGVWFASPGLLLAAAPSLYHEASAVAYAMAGAFVLTWVVGAPRGRAWGWTLAGLALCAGIALHARPNVAVGLYLGAVIAAGLALWGDGRRAIGPALVAMAVLGAAGTGYLGLNALRFGSVAQVHGSYEESSLRYGTVYWGIEEADSPRASAFVEHGRFNPSRILPNAGLYTFDMPERSVLAAPAAAIMSAYRGATADLGFIRVERPRMGMAWLWTGWLALCAAAPFARGVPPHMAGVLAATGAAAVLTLSYGTVTLRYRFDLWPAIAVLGAIGVYAVAPRLARAGGAILPAALGAAIAVGVFVSGATALAYRDTFRIAGPEVEDPLEGRWTQADCIENGRHLDLSAERLREVCSLPGEAAAR